MPDGTVTVHNSSEAEVLSLPFTADSFENVSDTAFKLSEAIVLNSTGDYSLTVRFGDKEIAGSPSTVRVVADAASMGTITLLELSSEERVGAGAGRVGDAGHSRDLPAGEVRACANLARLHRRGR